ncbi:MAG: 3-hydroxyacyl-CoA dehydrogenase NAD-binding domain-containing protein [Vicinamibacteraceae bacterium]
MMRTVTVLGAGTMGAQIAAHAANAGFEVMVLDVSADAARDGMKRAAALRPDPFFTRAHAQAIRTGGLETDLDAACRADWVVEAVVERLDIKQALFARVDAARAPHTIVTSNTSGIPIGALAEGRSEGFRRHFLGTHFFNPPRYLKLLELIPTPDTDPATLARIADLGDRRLGKGVVVAKDTPNFIGNHIGLYAIARILDVWAEGRLTIEEIDAMTGPAIGRPKSATFRTLDITGLDVLIHVARNLEGRIGAERARAFAPPPLALAIAERGWIGEKAGQGFYRREKRPGGQSEILALDPVTMTYRAQQKARYPSIDRARTIDDVGTRVRTLFLGDDPVGDFLRRTLGPTLFYTASVAPDIAHSLDDVDRAMRWGYGWELGPFELADAIGLRTLVDACPGAPVPPLVADRLATGADTFRDGRRVPSSAGVLLLTDAKNRTPIVAGNPGASLVDLGDGVLAVELHSKMNALGGDAIGMLQKAVATAEAQFAALVVSTDAVNFSVGANLMLLLIEAQEGNWDDIDLMIRGFQRATMGLRLSKVPVVVAPAGLTLGGGCEVALHGDRIQAAAETYIGLVEAGVGLIPAGGGTKEMLARATGHLTLGPSTDLAGPVRTVFETIGFARTSTSAAEARTLGLLRPVDRVSMNRDRLVADAKALALARVAEGYEAPVLRTAIPVGGAPVEAILKLGVHLAHRAERLSDHDALIGRRLAHILAGGSLAGPALVGEQYLLDLEREAFLSLCAEPKTLARIKHTLDTGKPLRN